jgi:hypothetical protein
MRPIHGVFDPALCLDEAWQLFHGHQAGADRWDVLFRWIVLSRCCREAEPA